MVKVWRQGDIVFVKLDQESPNYFAGEGRKGENIVIKSETGNPHIIHTAEAEQVVVHSFGNEFRDAFVESSKPILVEHPEHGKFTLPSGIYRIYRIREADEIGGLYSGTRGGFD
jgi:hypothetical protein